MRLSARKHQHWVASISLFRPKSLQYTKKRGTNTPCTWQQPFQTRSSKNTKKDRMFLESKCCAGLPSSARQLTPIFSAYTHILYIIYIGCLYTRWNFCQHRKEEEAQGWIKRGGDWGPGGKVYSMESPKYLFIENIFYNALKLQGSIQ